MPVPMRKKSGGREDGAALLTVAVVLALVGVFISFGLGAMKTQEPVDRRLETQRRMDFVVDQIASYVHRENRLPCPALPNANRDTVAFGREDRPSTDAACSSTTGILPFSTLNIDSSYAFDSWGRFITYAISPTFGDTRNPVSDLYIFYICRKGNGIWMDSSQPTPAPTPPLAATNSNPRKARFCCPGVMAQSPNPPYTDLEVRNEKGNPVNLRPDQTGNPPSPQRTTSQPATGSIAPPPNVTSDPVAQVMVTQRNVLTFAFVMLSHGANGYGAYDGASATSTLVTGDAGTDEIENGDRDIVFVDRPAVLVQGAGHFDDIVMWRTQFSIYNELNNASCARAWR